ncbi:winged helix-turn-helix domain-containing tetratricopeptide repeat protein [Roseobacter sp. A03A-229]
MELRRGDEAVHLEPKNFELLRYLVTNADRVVTKDEIFDQIWPDVFVTEASLSGAIKNIRKALGDDGDAQQFIRTVRGTGFRFVGVLAEKREAVFANAAAPDPHPAAAAGPPVIAVLPFVLVETDEHHGAIAEGIPAELISALSKLRAFKVIARGSSFKFGAVSPDYAAIRAALGAGYVLSGSVALKNRHLILVAELTDTRTEQILWSETYTGPLDDVFNVRQAIVREMCNAVDAHIPRNEADRLSGIPTENLSAWGHYHLGLHHLLWYRGAHNDISKEHMKQAIALDPAFARAHSALAYAELEDHNFLLSADGAASKSKGMALAEKAVDLDPFDPFCNLVLSRAHWTSKDIDAAVSWAGRSVQLNHNYALGHYELGKFHAIACSGVEADRFASTALSLSPLDPHVSGMLSARALAAYVRDDGQKAVQFATESMHAPNRHMFVCALAAAIYYVNGDTDRAEAAISKIDDRSKRSSLPIVEHLFTLKDPTKHRAMINAFERLGLA